MKKLDLCCYTENQFFITEQDGVVVSISNTFTDMTGYTIAESINRDVVDLFNILKIGPNADIHNINEEEDYFLFTKLLEVKLIKIKVIKELYKRTYIFCETTNYTIDSKFPFALGLALDSHYGIGIYSAPDMILLKANEKYISFFDEPYNKRENCIGRNIADIIGEYRRSIINTVLKTGRTYNVDEYMYKSLNKGVTYWQMTIVPIIENQEIKYCIVMTSEITEQVLYRKKIEEQSKIIQKQKNELDIVLENMIDGLAVIDKNGKYLKINRKFNDWIGNTVCRDVGDSTKYIEYYDMEGNKLDYRNFPAIRVARGERIENYELLMKANGKERYICVSGAPIYNEKGDFVVGVFNLKDITDSVKYLKMVEQQKLQLQTIMDNISDFIFVLDQEGNYIYANKTSERYHTKGTLSNYRDSLSESEYLYMNGKYIPEQELPYYTVLRTKSTDRRVFIERRRGNEKYFSITTVPLLDNNKNVSMVITCANDITGLIEKEREIKEKKEQIEKQNKLLEDVLDNLQESVYVCDRSGKYMIEKTRTVNIYPGKHDTFEELYAYRRCYKLDGTEISLEDTALYRVKNGVSTQNSITYCEVDGKKYYSLINAKPVFHEDGSLLYGIVSMLDITDLINSNRLLDETNQKLLKSEREKTESLEKAIEMKDEFLSLISHEFKTPLNVINTAVQTLNFICANELTDKMKEYIGIIRRNTFRQLRLVNNLLDITRINAGRIKMNKKNIDIVFLTKAITESVYTYALQKGVEISFEAAVKKKIIAIDDEKYERILLNLLSNAIKFTEHGKKVNVKLSHVKGSICIEVKDSGIGIPNDKLKLIFERFGQVDSSLSRQAEGTGIGLSLVKRFVEALGGSISVRSKVGKGSSFIVMLPDKKLSKEESENQVANLVDNCLVQTTSIEFSDIYL